jgi:hypothetical protein
MDLPPIIVNLAQFVAPFVGELARLNAQGVTINSVLKKNENKITDKENALSEKYDIFGVSFTIYFLKGTVLKSIRKFLKTLADDVDKQQVYWRNLIMWLRHLSWMVLLLMVLRTQLRQFLLM